MTSAAARTRLPGQVTAIAAAFLVSCLGDGLAITALMLDFHDRATGGLGIAALFGAMSVPAILLAGLAGRISDRHPARRVLPPLGVGLVGVCAVMSLTDAVALLVGLLAVLSGLMAIAAPVFVKALFQASPAPLISRAGALVSMASNLGFLIGPAVGALLMDAVGLRGVLLMDAATYLAVPLVALCLPAPPKSATTADPARPVRQSGFLAGLRILGQHLHLARVVLVGLVLTFALQVTNVVEIYLVRDSYGATATVFGLLTTAWATGQIIGAGTAGRLLSERATARPAALTACAVGAALLAIAALNSLPVLFVLTALAGAANGAFGVVRQTALGRTIDSAGQGSAAAAHAALLNSATIAGLVGAGFVGAVVQPRTVYVLAGGLLLLALAAAHVYRRTGPAPVSATRTEPGAVATATALPAD
ncbi:MFS transporter [Streptomyces sp. NPDC015684]|uniref:MFS transporter n=1 Tax=Streptomyces sp. NPDC015684 TaxID=3364963 RepID=UPI0036FBA0B4